MLKNTKSSIIMVLVYGCPTRSLWDTAVNMKLKRFHERLLLSVADVGYRRPLLVAFDPFLPDDKFSRMTGIDQSTVRNG